MKKFLVLVLSLILGLSMVSLVGCNNAKTITVNVDGQVATDGSEVNGVKTFKTIQGAIDYYKNESATAVKVINLKEGNYNEKISVPKEVKNLQLIGSSTGVSKITYGDYAGMAKEGGGIIGTDATATANVYGEGFVAKNVYFENSFDYFNPPAGVKDLQALAMYCRADKVIFENCTFTGYQDTLEVVEGRQYFKNCTIKGCVDFIFGNNPSVLFDNCDIVNVKRNKSGDYITAMKGNNGTNGQGVAKYGLVFKNCRLTSEGGVNDESVALGRPWRADATVAWINCEMGSHIAKKAYGTGGCRYTAMEGGTDENGNKINNMPMNAFYAEYGNTGVGVVTENLYCKYTYRDANGKVIIATGEKPDFTLLTKEQADLYTPENIFATVNGGVTYVGEWNPCK